MGRGEHAGRVERSRFWWDRDRLAAEEGPSGALRVYVYEDPHALVPFMWVDYASRDDARDHPGEGERYYVFTDHRGCPERVEDDGGEVVWEATIHPYGECEVHVGADFHQPLRFPGHYYDDATGLHYNRFRYYSPELGRYLESDPVGIAGGLNLYGYCCDSNPLRDVDLRGLTKRCPRRRSEDGAAEEGADAERAAMEDAFRQMDLSDPDDRATARMNLEEHGIDPEGILTPARNLDPNCVAQLNDPSRRPVVTRRTDGALVATISHGPRAGETTTVIRGHDAGTTRDGVTRDDNGFVVLNSRFDTVLDDSHLGSGNAQNRGGHFEAANQNLANALRADPGLADRIGLSEAQAAHFLREPTPTDLPSDMTWHHHQDAGRMQLVSRAEHRAACPHSGGMSIWGGGYDN
ncbi:MAG: HNH endonuclease [Sandaracinaceae bacterium]|nr:HNH endonuclease [Sandaracinaceae bacterium]